MRGAAFAGETAAGGRLQLGVTSLVAGYVLSDILARYRRAFPGGRGDARSRTMATTSSTCWSAASSTSPCMVISNLRDRMALQAEIIEVSPYRLWLPLGHHLAGAEIIGIHDIAARAADHAHRRRDRGEHRQAAGRRSAPVRMSPSARARSRRSAAWSPPAPGIALLPDLVYRPWSLEGDRIESRDVSGSLPVGAGRHGLAARLRSAAGGTQFHRHRAGTAYRAPALN